MDPAAITALATFFTALNGWSVGTVIILVFLVPPLLGLVAVLKIVGAMSALKDEIRAKNDQDNKRFETIVTQFNRQFETIVAMFNQQLSEFANKYDNNIYLVKSWEKTAGDMTNLVYLNTQAITTLGNKFDQLISIWNSDRNGRKQ